MPVLTATVFNIQKYSIHDGPGIRTTVFLKGCPLACLWCHNPESHSTAPEIAWHKEKCIGCLTCQEACPLKAAQLTPMGIAIDKELCNLCGKCTTACPTLALEMIGKVMTMEEVFEEVNKDAVFYQQSGGGVTLSGGEPLSQPGFATEFLRLAKELGYHTALDTCGFAPQKVFEAVLPHTDLFLYDIKFLDDAAHKKYVQAPLTPVLRNLRYLAHKNATIWVRVPVVPTINDSPGHMERIALFIKELGLKEVYLLPYHKMATAKYSLMHRPYALAHLEEPTAQQMQNIGDIFAGQGLAYHLGG